MFPPAFAPRMGYLCKFLKQEGWEISVVTEYINDQTFQFLEGNATVTYLHYYNAPGKFLKKIQWIIVMLLDFLFHYKDKKIIKACEPFLRSGQYTGIICSTYRTFPLPAAQALAQKYSLPFIADLRDIIEEYASTEYIAHTLSGIQCVDDFITGIFTRRLLNDRNKALKAAHCVTSVSPWHVQVLRQYNPHTKLIYNGFDPELFYPEQIKTSKFTITYTGRLLSLAIRNPELLFKAVAKLLDDQVISNTDFRVVWYTDPESQAVIETETKRCHIESVMEYHGYVPATEIPSILNKSSILLSLTNKFESKGPKGFMTTKFFESLAVEKPILCVRSDEAHLAQTIQETHSGLAATEVDEVYDFIKRYYEEWKETGYTTIEVDKKKLATFSRKEQAHQFVELFKEFHQ